MQPWHDVDLGDGLERDFRAVIESPGGSSGFLPRTLCDAAAAVDVLGPEPVAPLCALRGKATGRGRSHAEQVVREAARLDLDRIILPGLSRAAGDR